METVECDRERLSTDLQAALQEADSSKNDHEALSLQLAQVQGDLAKHKVCGLMHSVTYGHVCVCEAFIKV